MRRSARRAALLVAFGWLIAAPAAARERLEGQEAPFHITADSIEYERTRDLYVARGNVRITQPDRSLTADWASFSNTTRQGVATGNVVVVEGGDTLYADFLHFEVDTLNGVVLKGRLDGRDSEFRMEGEEIRKTGPETYVFKDGSFTTCRCPPGETDPWTIRAERADLEIGGYGTARNTTVDVLGVPVLWFPWMIYPLKTDRESGFLFPEFNASSRSGGDIGLPFFWAARHNLNVILTNSYLFKRGYKVGTTFEYVFGEKSWGEFYGTYVPHDKDIEEDDPETPFSDERWGTEWLHDQGLPWDLRWKVDAVVLSDNQFARDFREFRGERRNRFIESLSFVERLFGPSDRFGVNAAIWYADDIQNPDDQDRDPFLLHRLPDVRFAGLPSPALGRNWLVPSFDVRVTNFYQQRSPGDVLPDGVEVDDLFLDTGIDAIPDGEERNEDGDIVTLDGEVIQRDGTRLTAAQFLATQPPGTVLDPDGSQDDFPPGPEGDGRFQEGEPLTDEGQRMVLNPRLALPFRVADLVELYPEVGYHGTFYNTQDLGYADRHLVTGRLDLRTRLRANVELPFEGGEAVHLVEPRFGYAVVSQAHQSENPLFVPEAAVSQFRVRELELDNLTRDPADRIESFNGFTLGFGNKLYVPGGEGEPLRLFGDVDLAAQYEFAGSKLGNFVLDGVFFPREDLVTAVILGYDLDENRISEGGLGFGWESDEGHDLRLEYRYLRDIPRFFENFRFDEERFDEFEEGFVHVNQVGFFGRLPLTRFWAVTYRADYSIEESFFLTNQLGIEYISKCLCWAIRAEFEQDRSDGFQFQLAYRIIGLGQDKVRPFQRRRARRTEEAQP